MCMNIFGSLIRLFMKANWTKNQFSATGISVRSLQCFKREEKDGCISSLWKKGEDISSVDEVNICRVSTSFYERGEIPTLENILEKVKMVPITFNGQNSSLHRLMKKLGFRFKKTDGGRHIFMERDDIILTQCIYLQKIKENRDE